MGKTITRECLNALIGAGKVIGMDRASLVYVQRQLGHFSITITVDTYTHWIEKAERGDVLEVDRLSRVSSSEAVTLTGATA